MMFVVRLVDTRTTNHNGTANSQDYKSPLIKHTCDKERESLKDTQSSYPG